MTTRTLPERMGVLETEVEALRGDVTEVKRDVKDIGAKLDQVALTLAVKEAVADATKAGRASTGVWVRFLTERGLAILALIAAVFSIVKG